MRYDLNLLPVFVTLMEERNVTRAAERLGITQPALSNALARLRLMMKDQLFIRARYGIEPTPLARDLAPMIAAALGQIDDVVLGQQDFEPATAERLVTVAANSYVEFGLIPAIVARLGEIAPGIRLRMVPYGSELAETGVISGTTEMVFGRIVGAPDNLVVQHLMDDGLACVVRADHPGVGDKLTRAQYERMKHVNVMPPGRLRAGLYQQLEREGVKRDVVVSVTHFLSVPELIAVTDYCTMLPRLICRHLARDTRLKVLKCPVDLGTFPIEMAWHMRYRNDPAHRWLRGMIVDIARELSDSLARP